MPPGAVLSGMWGYDDLDEGATVEVDNKDMSDNVLRTVLTMER